MHVYLSSTKYPDWETLTPRVKHLYLEVSPTDTHTEVHFSSGLQTLAGILCTFTSGEIPLDSGGLSFPTRILGSAGCS